MALADLADAQALPVMFLSHHCPYVKHVEATPCTTVAGRDGPLLFAIDAAGHLFLLCPRMTRRPG